MPIEVTQDYESNGRILAAILMESYLHVDTSEDSLKWRLHAIAYFLFPTHVDKGMI